MIEEGVINTGSDFKSWSEKIREEKANRKLPDWVYNTIRNIKSWFWYRILEHPEDLRNWLIHKFQRAQRGWSHRDTWGFHDTIANIIIGGIKHLKKTKHGIPMSVCNSKTDNSDEEFEKAEKRWDKILDNIILTFEVSKKISNDHWMYQKSEKYDIKLAKKWRKIHKEWLEEDPELWKNDNLYVMTKAECKVYEKGWKLFQEHFFGLND